MPVCADGQGICMQNKSNQPSSSSVSRDEGLVCFPPLNQSFTICWACWQLPSRAEGLRDTTPAPGYHDRGSRIISSTKQSFKSVLKGASWELHGNEGESRRVQVSGNWDDGQTTILQKGGKGLRILHQQSGQEITAHCRCLEHGLIFQGRQ